MVPKIFKVQLAFCCCLCLTVCNSQSIVNAYANVSAISGNSVIAVNNVNIANHTFAVGSNIVIMQMQDDVIGTNTTNVASFGDVGSIGSAGRFEVKKILAVSPSSGTPTTITLDSQLANSYNIGSNSSVQLITFRNLGANYTTTASITGLSWNGSVGGVIAIEVTNTLTLRHAINANAIGFTGGAMSSAADEACVNSVYIINSNLKGFKGEGIYKNTNANFNNGRGKIINGGGGGAQNNTGGGGGGNYTSGGLGGTGWACTTANSGRGIGGLSMSTYISGTRIFMGGGGGGGQQNNGVGTAGASGGGIILIKAGAIVSGTTCSSSLSVTANGGAANDSGNDGAGGGGAGGSIIIQSASFSLTATCPLTVSANGGRGGSVTNSGEHGGGGGGGQGVIIYSGAQPTANVTSQTNVGIGGANSSSSGSTSASNGSGTNGSGITSGSITVLPIKLINFTGIVLDNNIAELRWQTATEKNCKEFQLERSVDGVDFSEVAIVAAHGTSSVKQSYVALDSLTSQKLVYYRLRSIDFDGSFDLSSVISITPNQSKFSASIAPNPVSKSGLLQLSLFGITGSETISLLDIFGKQISQYQCGARQRSFVLDLSLLNIPSGMYFVKINGTNNTFIQKLVVTD